MANTKDWIKSLNNSGHHIYYSKKTTTDVYSKISDLGLQTVLWESYAGADLLENLSNIEKFLKKNSPVLFIYDPKENTLLEKSFLFNTNFNDINFWIKNNSKHINHYNYLITTQIHNTGDGFVGTAISDGGGNVLIETLHKPGVSNHRELSQPKGNISKYLSHAYINNDFVSVDSNSLSKKHLDQLIKLYLNKKGYFEFVYGVQKNIKGFYTTGYEDKLFPFPKDIHTLYYINPENRFKGKIIMNEEC